MSKKRKADPKPVTPVAPKFQGSEVRYGGRTVGKTYLDANGNMITDYLEDPAEAQRKAQRQSKIDAYEGKINVFDPKMISQWDQTKQAFSDKNREGFDKMWDESSRQTREDTASRFGNIDTSVYSDRMSDLDEMKSNAYTDISRDSQLLREQLQDNELDKRYQYLNWLQSGVDNAESMAQQAYNNATSSNQLINNFNQGNYGTQAGIYGNDLSSWTNLENQRRQQQEAGLFRKIFGGISTAAGLGLVSILLANVF